MSLNAERDTAYEQVLAGVLGYGEFLIRYGGWTDDDFEDSHNPYIGEDE